MAPSNGTDPQIDASTGRAHGVIDLAQVRRIKRILRQARLDQNMTFRQLEMASGISFSYLASSERSDNQPALIVFLRWCRALGLTFDEVCRNAAQTDS